MSSVKILRLSDVETKKILGGPIKVMFTPETANTKHLRFAVGYFSPGEGLRAHVHPESEEVYYVVRGEGTVYLGEDKKPIKVEANTAIYIPPKTVHGIMNTGKDRLIVAFFVAPGREKAEVA
jgi:mannose-6-phosphate isomerase-like protein (cupin superfamily)